MLKYEHGRAEDDTCKACSSDTHLEVKDKVPADKKVNNSANEDASKWQVGVAQTV